MAGLIASPNGDRAVAGSWIKNPNTGFHYEKVDEGASYDSTDYVEHVTGAGNDGTAVTFNMQDSTSTFNAYSYYGNVRIRWVDIIIRASLLEAGSKIESKLVYIGTPDQDIDNSIIYVPGTKDVDTQTGNDFLELVGAFRGVRSLYNPLTGNDWTAAELDNIGVKVRGWGKVRVYTIWLEVDMVIQAQVIPGLPYYPNQSVGIYEPIRWGFNNSGEGSQKKYHVRVFTASQYTTAVGSGNIWTSSSFTLDSGEVNSSQTFHEFARRIGGKRYPALDAGTWTVAIRAAKDYRGQDWWSPDFVQTMVINNYTDSASVPTEGATLTTTSRPVFTVTSTIPTAKRIGSDWRVYGQPSGGWPTDWDPDTSTFDPIWQTHVDGSGLTAQPKLEDSLPNNSVMRLAVRHYALENGDPTPWLVVNFGLSAPTAPAAQSVTFTGNVAAAGVDYNIDFYSNTKSDEVQELQVIRGVTGYDNEFVRLPAPNIDHGLKPVGIRLPGTSGNNISSTNIFSHTTSLEVESGLWQANWNTVATTTLGARWLPTGNFRSWWFRLKNDRNLELQWSNNGTAVLTATATTGIPVFSANTEVWFRAKLTVTNPYNVQFHYSTDHGLNWTQVGSTVTGGAATTIFDTSSNGVVEVGSTASGTADLAVAIHTHFAFRAIGAGTWIASWDAYTGNYLNSVSGGISQAINGTVPSFYYHVSGTDYEIPFNVQIIYLIQYIVKDTTANEYQWSSVGLQAVTVLKKENWLKSVSTPADNAQVLATDSWVTRETNKLRSVRQPLGRKLPVVTKSAAEKGEQFTYQFTVVGATAVDRMIRVLDSGSTLVVVTPKRRTFVEVSGNWSQKEQLLDTKRGEQDARIFTVPMVEVKCPSVASIF